MKFYQVLELIAQVFKTHLKLNPIFQLLVKLLVVECLLVS